jgi:hypothetical protein
MDKITEAIAHFIGLFQTAVEEARLRKDYEEFQALAAQQPEQPSLLDVDVEVRAPHEFVGWDPALRYQPVPPDLVLLLPGSPVAYEPPNIPSSTGGFPDYPGLPTREAAVGSARVVREHKTHEHKTLEHKIEYQIDPPGSIAVYINQDISLSDNDYVGAGGHGLKFTPVADHGAEMAALLHGAARLSPVGDLEAPGSAAEIEGFILEAASALETFAAAHEEDDDIFVVNQAVIEGSYVNGEIATEIPKLEDHHPGEKEDGPEDPDPVNSVKGKGTFVPEASVDVEAGANTLVNSAVLTNSWLSGPVIATAGDNVEVNAIVQVNVWSDADSIGTSVDDWQFDPDEATEAFNIAMFTRVDPTNNAAPVAPGDFPEYWAATVIEGDVIFMNWIEQFSFVMDNDVHVLSSSGVKTIITTGGNSALNDVSLTELGLYYDLIIVGGSIYDMNFIQQMNILLDNDLIGGVAGFETTGDASLSTSGNLLWNYAGIVNIGDPDRFETMPEAYRKTIENLESGNKELASDVLKDNAFEGLNGLRVLYVSGSILDLQYIKQTNILGDSDQVALAMNSATESHPEADWTVSTGSNALINSAQIVDVDAMGTTYLGGNQYSDEILIQAELVSADPDLGGRDPDILVTEAVAFLDEDLSAPDGEASLPLHSNHDAPHVDVMQSMLA